VLRFNTAHADPIYADIAADAFADLADEPNRESRCAAFIDRLAALSRTLGLPPRLRDVGIGAEHLPTMARDAMKQTRLLVNNPRAVTETDALAIYQSAW
jgi:alcohol dehydrogenase class IV